MKTIRVLLADNHAIVRAGLRALLNASADIQVIGEAGNGRQALHEAQRLRPDVLLLDVAMPLSNGVEVARQLARKLPAIRVLVLSSYSDAFHLRQAVEAGVAGYLMKEAAADDLLSAIREAFHGGAPFSPPFLTLLKEWGTPPNGCRAIASAASLSGRHAEVLQLIAEGYVSKQIAVLLSLSTKTVQRHRQTLMDKLGLHNVSTLTRYAVANGVVELNNTPLQPDWPPPASHLGNRSSHGLAVIMSHPMP